ncbi:MAG: SEC-C domain-containing protein [Desulfobulbaceae bacterium]|nr:SEC-C domain-containing protein [Desulfobulbaceae bacterium]
MQKTGRNDQCPCGSGKKLKKCCINKSNDQDNASNPPPPIKISAAILQMIEPLIKRYPGRKRITILIDLAVMAWNASLTTEENREDMESIVVKHMPKKMGAVDIAAILERIDLLVDKKIKLFPDINYWIVNHDLKFDSAERLTLDINSTFLKPAGNTIK